MESDQMINWSTLEEVNGYHVILSCDGDMRVWKFNSKESAEEAVKIFSKLISDFILDKTGVSFK